MKPWPPLGEDVLPTVPPAKEEEVIVVECEQFDAVLPVRGVMTSPLDVKGCLVVDAQDKKLSLVPNEGLEMKDVFGTIIVRLSLFACSTYCPKVIQDRGCALDEPEEMMS